MKKKRTKPYCGKIIPRRIHDEITNEQTEKIREIYSSIGRAFGNTFEQFERDFLFYEDIDRDIEWWRAMDKVFRRSLKRFPAIAEADLAQATVCISLRFGSGKAKLPPETLQYLEAKVPTRSSFLIQ